MRGVLPHLLALLLCSPHSPPRHPPSAARGMALGVGAVVDQGDGESERGGTASELLRAHSPVFPFSSSRSSRSRQVGRRGCVCVGIVVWAIGKGACGKDRSPRCQAFPRPPSGSGTFLSRFGSLMLLHGRLVHVAPLVAAKDVVASLLCQVAGPSRRQRSRNIGSILRETQERDRGMWRD